MRVFAILGVIFTLIGFAILMGGAITFDMTTVFVERAERTNGVVVAMVEARGSGGDRAVKPRVRYVTREGLALEVVGTVASNPPAFSAGDEVAVLYDPADPGNARIDSLVQLWFVPMLLGGLGGVFLTIGVAFLITVWRRRRMLRWLHDMGRRVQAAVTGVEINRRVRVNHRSPYRIICRWSDASARIWVFRSDGIWFDPKPFITEETIDVLVDPRDPKRYWVDTSFLPERGSVPTRAELSGRRR